MAQSEELFRPVPRREEPVPPGIDVGIVFVLPGVGTVRFLEEIAPTPSKILF